MAKLLVIHGPNLNLLGTREPEHYGTTSLADIDNSLRETAQQAGHSLSSIQSNAEHELVNAIENLSEAERHLILRGNAARLLEIA